MSDIQKRHIDEGTVILQKFKSEIDSMTFQETFRQYFRKLPPFDRRKVVDFEPAVVDPALSDTRGSHLRQQDLFTPKPLISDNEDSDDIPSEFSKIMQQDLNRLIMTGWDGKALNNEDKKTFRHLIRFKCG